MPVSATGILTPKFEVNCALWWTGADLSIRGNGSSVGGLSHGDCMDSVLEDDFFLLFTQGGEADS